MANLIYCITITIMLTSAFSNCNGLNSSTAVFMKIISAIRNHFHSGCVYLVHRSDEITGLHGQAVHLRKLLSANNVPVTVMSGSARNSSDTCKCQQNRPLNVLLVNHEAPDLSFIQPVQPEEIWLLFMGSAATSLEDMFNCIHLPFDSQFLVARSVGHRTVQLSEVYRIAAGWPLVELSFGTWSAGAGLNVTAYTFNKRRSDLSGLRIRATVINNPPGVRLMQKDDGSLQVNGIIGNAFNILEKEINFTVNFSLLEEEKWGTLKNGTWTGIIGKLQRKEVDVAVNGMFMTSQRMDALDYTLPILYTKYAVFIKKPDNNMEWGNFLAPFSSKLWFAVIIAIVGLALYLTLLYYCGRRYGNQEAEGPPHYDLYDSLLYMFGVFCSQGQYLSPRSYSCRLVYLTANLIAVVLLAAYSGTLISFLTAHHYKLPFTDFPGLLADKAYKFGLFNIPDEWYKTNESFPLLHNAYAEIIKHDSSGPPSTALEGLQRVCGIKFAFLLPQDMAHALSNDINCTLATLPHGSFKASLSIAMAKRSPYRSLFTYKLHEMRGSGIIHKLRQRELAPQFLEEQPWRRVSMNEATPIFTILFFGLVASFLLLFLERRFSPFCYQSPNNSTVNIRNFKLKPRHSHYVLGRDETIPTGFPFLH